ncbi:hypothetical protein H4R20_002708 [Coemansia guatemalensis]|uniref:Uncharacterized protein n=1 Tax=Coemansia guatemalensis TaxID=2761395 RepID=A0A9W8I3A8_9FUNG|nr:hypothetical protein H4R20_002708 [Coemansia guatemalensis]
MRVFAALTFALSVALAQQGGILDGPKLALGDSTVANPNFNSGVQADSSLISGKGGSGDRLNNVADSTFANLNVNGVLKDDIVNNPSFDSVSGNGGWTANGNGDSVGSPGITGALAPFLRRSGGAGIADSHHNVPRPNLQVTRPPQTAHQQIGSRRTTADIVQIVRGSPHHGVRRRRRAAI